MTLTLGTNDHESIRRHGESTYPEECCGFLLGTGDGDDKNVVGILRADNQRRDSARNRYLIAPEDYLAAELQAQRSGLEIVGFYHSHPDSEARPSEFDRKQALPWCSYLIVTVVGGRAEGLSSWVLAEDHSEFIEEMIASEGGGH
jgi:proteasome lid subunit RPN8/RPN11